MTTWRRWSRTTKPPKGSRASPRRRTGCSASPPAPKSSPSLNRIRPAHQIVRSTRRSRSRGRAAGPASHRRLLPRSARLDRRLERDLSPRRRPDARPATIRSSPAEATSAERAARHSDETAILAVVLSNQCSLGNHDECRLPTCSDSCHAPETARVLWEDLPQPRRVHTSLAERLAAQVGQLASRPGEWARLITITGSRHKAQGIRRQLCDTYPGHEFRQRKLPDGRAAVYGRLVS